MVIWKIFIRTLFSRKSFVKIKPLRNGKIPLSFIDIGKSCLCPEFFTSLICLLMLFAKIKFSQKFPNLQYGNTSFNVHNIIPCSFSSVTRRIAHLEETHIL